MKVSFTTAPNTGTRKYARKLYKKYVWKHKQQF